MSLRMLSSRCVAGAFALVVGILMISGASVRAQAADFGGYRPHYQGFGVETPGGRGGAVYKVTNLNDSGPGSLRAALQASGPRFVVFETSGTIQLRTAVYITNPFLTIAGQTAPSPGITVRDAPVYIDTHDVVVQHMRFRMGDTTCPSPCTGYLDSLYIRAWAYNIVLDHLSVSWGTHGNLSISSQNLSPDPREIAILDSIFSEPLAKSNNPFGTGITGMPSVNGTWTHARNLHAHQGVRSPWVGPGWRFSAYNNVVYNGGCCKAAGDGHANDAGAAGFMQVMADYGARLPFEAVWVSNVNVPGPSTHPSRKTFKVSMTDAEAAQENKMYLADNTGPYLTMSNQWGGVTYQGVATEAEIRTNTMPAWHAAFGHKVLSSSAVLASVLQSAGARPLDRDAVDRRIVGDVTNRTGAVIFSQSQVGGWPTLTVRTRAYTVPANPNQAGSCGFTSSGVARTQIECDLEAKARALEPGTPQGTELQPPTNLRIVR